MRCRRPRPRANLVFLIDTSGSMNAPNRLPLVKQSLAMLLTQLAPDDRVAIVTYAGHAGTALEPTAASDKRKIAGVIERLDARQHRRGRGHSAGLCAGRAEFRSQRRQPGDPGDRRRLQRRHHRQGRAQGLHRAPAREDLPLHPRLRHGQLRRRPDAGAPRTATASPPISTRSTRPAKCWSTST